MLSDPHVESALAELCAAFGRPFGAEQHAMIGTWRRALNDLEPDELRYAVGRLTKEAEKFPSPKAVRTLGFWLRTSRRQQAKQEQGQLDQPLPFCSRCGAHTLIEDFWGRLRPRHADNCPGLHPADLQVQRLSLDRATPTPTPGD